MKYQIYYLSPARNGYVDYNGLEDSKGITEWWEVRESKAWVICGGANPFKVSLYSWDVLTTSGMEEVEERAVDSIGGPILVGGSFEVKADLKRYRQPGAVDFKNDNLDKLKFISVEKGCYIPNKGVLNFLILNNQVKKSTLTEKPGPYTPEWIRGPLREAKQKALILYDDSDIANQESDWTARAALWDDIEGLKNSPADLQTKFDEMRNKYFITGGNEYSPSIPAGLLFRFRQSLQNLLKFLAHINICPGSNLYHHYEYGRPLTRDGGSECSNKFREV